MFILFRVFHRSMLNQMNNFHVDDLNSVIAELEELGFKRLSNRTWGLSLPCDTYIYAMVWPEVVFVSGEEKDIWKFLYNICTQYCSNKYDCSKFKDE